MAFTAVLLAGGESRRMGREKATLIWRGRPLWEWQLEKLCELHPTKILLSARSDPPWRPAGVQFVPDLPPSRGPLSGLAAALACTDTTHLLALAIDMPFMTAAQLRYLCGLATVGAGVVSRIHNRVEPLAAIYPAVALADFQKALHAADASMQAVVRKITAAGRLHVLTISDEDRSLYKSLNEPQDFD